MSLSLELFVRKRLTFQDLNNKIQLPIQNYINEKCVIQDEVSEDIAAYKIVRRDAKGRVKFAAPGAPEHGARKAEVDAHEGKTSTHGATATPTASRIAMYDSSGRLSSGAAPSNDNHVIRKVDLDSHINSNSAHSATAAATPNRIMMRDANGRAKVAAPVKADDIARKAEVDDVRNYVKSIYHVSLPLGTHWGNTIEPRKRTTVWHVPWKIPTGKTLYLDRAAYHFNNSPHLRLHICSYRSTPSQVLWSSPNASDDIWAGFPLIPPQPTDYITVEIYNSSSEYTQSFDNTSGIWLQFGIA